MKKLEIIIKPEKLEDLKALLDSEEVNGLNIVNSMGYGNQKGIIKNYRGAEYAVRLIPVTSVMVKFSCMRWKTRSVSEQASMV